MLFNPYRLRQDLDEAIPFLVVIAVVVAVEEAVTELDFKPLANLACGFLESIFE